MSGSDGIIRAAAVAVSVLLHGLLFFNTGSVADNRETAKPERTLTRVSFRAASSPQAVSQPLPPHEKAPPEPQVTEAPERPPRPVAPNEAMHAQKARQPEAKRVEVERSVITPSVATAIAAEKVPEPPEALSSTTADPALIEKARQEYLRRLMAHIEAHKAYPKAARRRRIEGDVRVIFTLQAGGTVSLLQAQGGHRLLSEAARQAVERAAPMPQPPQEVALPWEVGFTMRFSLN